MDPVTGSAFNRPEPGSGRVLGGDRPGMSSEVAAVESGVSPAVGSNGSGRPAGCRRSRWPDCRAGTCRSPSERRSRSCMRSSSGRARSSAGSVVHHRRSRESSPQRVDSQSLGDVSGDDRANDTQSGFPDVRRGKPTPNAGSEMRSRSAVRSGCRRGGNAISSD